MNVTVVIPEAQPIVVGEQRRPYCYGKGKGGKSSDCVCVFTAKVIFRRPLSPAIYFDLVE